MTDTLKTPLYAEHQALNAKIVDFGGWALPVNYGSQIEEHNAVRNDCGMFDVSHMTVSDVTGKDTLPFLRKLLANDIDKVTSLTGKALYSCMLNEQGGVIDDLIAYYLNDEHCRLVTNAGTNEKDMAWLQKQAQDFEVVVVEKPQLALIAVQGPNAIKKSTQVLGEHFAEKVTGLKRFQGVFSDGDESEQFVARTGYTGEDGFEFITTIEFATQLWRDLIAAGVQPCGLGARDTLRLEAGMSLYGNDLDEQHNPLESGLSWTVSLDEERDFIGKTALAETPRFKQIGLILQQRGVLRGHQKILLNCSEIGEITSGTFSPTLEQSIAIARVDRSAKVKVGDTVQVEIRNKQLNAIIVKVPFVKSGKVTNV